jgi:hypothetical protein
MCYWHSLSPRRPTLVLDVSKSSWHWASTDARLGEVGSEGGAIILDESYGDAARITLERFAGQVPFTVTCGVSGLLVHTRFFESEADARSQFDAMKVGLARLVDVAKSPRPMQLDHDSSVTQLCQDFVERFP